MPNKARVYRIDNNFNPRCSKCSLSTQGAIGGHSFCGNNEVELLVVAAYPTREELKKGYSLAPNTKRDTKDGMNAGRFVRASINSTFNSDSRIPKNKKPFYKYVAFSNMIKCSPIGKLGKTKLTDLHINSCKNWLEKEIEILSHFNTNMPIMLCGSEAVKLLGKDMKVFSKRRQIYLYKNQHPVVISFNPVEVIRYTPYEISEKKYTNSGRLIVEDTRVKSPIVFSSPAWQWNNDLATLKELIINNLRYRNALPYKYTFEQLYNRFS